MQLTDFARRAEQIIALSDAAGVVFQVDAYGRETSDPERFGTFRAAGLAFFAKTFGEDHAYYREFEVRTRSGQPDAARAGRGILIAARDEVAGGWAVSARGLVSAEIFTDFLEMSQHLLDEGYKDAAGVITGSTLEEHLRQLAKKHGVAVELPGKEAPTPKRADALNADLTKAGAYGLLQQKSITAWLDLRNKAAHGRYGEYSREEVALMLQGILQFMSAYPA